MPIVAFTDLAIKSLKPGDYFDERTPAFGIRVGKNRRTWIVIRGKERSRTRIGHYPEIPLATARKKALVLLGSPIEANDRTTFAEARRTFLDTYCTQHQSERTRTETERLLNKHFKSLDERAAAAVTTPQLSAILDGLLGTPSEAQHAFKAARTFFRWAEKRGYGKNPCTMEPPSKEKPRERVLTPEELVAVYRAGTGLFGDLVRLLILTLARRGEIGSMRWEYVNFDEKTITWPGAVTKNGRTHVVYLTDTARDILKKLPKSSPFVFPARVGGGPFAGYSASKLHHDTLSKVENYTLHDLRRTGTTMAAAFTEPHVLERMLGHVTGTLSPLARTYNLFAYWEERKASYAQWETRLTALLAVPLADAE